MNREVKFRIGLRDIIASPFVVLGGVFILLGVYIGGGWTAERVVEAFYKE